MPHSHFPSRLLDRAAARAAAGIGLALVYALGVDEAYATLGQGAPALGVLLAAAAGASLGWAGAVPATLGMVAAQLAVPTPGTLAADLAWSVAMAACAAAASLLHGRRRAAVLGLRALQHRHARVVANMRDVLFETDVDGSWTYLSPAWTELTGEDPALRLGLPVIDIVHPDDQDEVREIFRGLVGGSALDAVGEARVAHADGSHRWVLARARARVGPAGEVVGATGWLMDVTERKDAAAALARADEALARRDAVLRAIPRAGRALLGTPHGPEGVHQALQALAEPIHADRVALLQLQLRPDGERRLVRRYAWAAPGIPDPEQDLRGRELVLDAAADSPLLRVVAGEAVILRTRDLPEPARRCLPDTEVHAFAAVPVHVQGQVWGILGFDDCHGGREWGPPELDGLRAGAEMLGAGLARAEADSRFQAVLEASPAAIYTLRVRPGEPPRVEWASPGVPRVLGGLRQESLGHDWWQSVVHPDDLALIRDVGLPTPDRPSSATEYRVRALDGGWRWVRDEQRLMRAEGDELVVAGSWIDITVRREAEEGLRELTAQLEARVEGRTLELRDANQALAGEVQERRRMQAQLERSERYFRSLIENATDVTAIFAEDGRLTYVSPSLERLLGWSTLEMIGQPFAEYVHPDDAPGGAERFASLLAREGAVARSQYRLRHADGSWRILEITSRNLLHDPAVRGVVANGRDVTEREEALEQLRRSERDYHGLFENSQEAIIIFDPADEVVLDANPRACELYGRSRDDLIGASLVPLSRDPDAGRARVEEVLASAGGAVRFETVQYRADGTELHLEVNASSVQYRGRAAILSSNRDVTERVRAQEQRERTLSLLQATLESTADGIAVVDLEGRMVSWNARFAQIWRMPPEILARRDDAAAQAWAGRQVADPGAFAASVRDLYARPEAESLDLVPMSDGRRFERFTRPQRVGDAIVGRVWSYRDVTERERSRAEVERSLSLLQATLESTADGIVVVGLDRRMVHWNGRFLEMWGLRPADLAGEQEQAVQAVAERVDDPDAFIAAVAAAADDPRAESRDVVRLRDGRVFESYSRPQRLGDRVVGRVWSFRDTTDRERAAEALRASEERFRQITDHIHQVFYMVEVDDGRVSYVSPAFRDIFGIDPEELLERRDGWRRLLHPDDRARFEAAVASPTEGVSVSYRIIRPDGETRWLQSSTVPVHDAQGRVYRVAGITEDVTDRVLAEQAVRDSEARFREIAGTLRGVFYMAESSPPRVTYLSPAYEATFGRDPAELLADVGAWLRYVHPDDRERVREVIFRGGVPVDHTYRLVWPDGEVRWLHTRGLPVVDEDGVSRRSVGLTEDVTGRVLAERALAASEERFRQMAETIREVFFIQDRETGEMLYVSPAFEEIWGRPVRAVMDDPAVWTDAVHPADAPEAPLDEAEPGGQESTYRIVRPDGDLRWIRSRRFAVRDEAGRVYRVAGLAEDITERVRADEALRAGEERFRQIAETIREVFYIYDLNELRLLYVSPAYQEIWGRSTAEVLMDPSVWLRGVHPDDAPALQAAMGTGGDEYEAEYRVVRPDGEVRWIWGRGFPVRDAAGRVYREVGIAEDVTARKAAEGAIRLAERRAQDTAARMRAVATAAAAVVGATSAGELRDVLEEVAHGVLDFDVTLLLLYGAEDDVFEDLGGVDEGRRVSPSRVPAAGTPARRVVMERRTSVTRSSADPDSAGARLTATGRRSESAVRAPILAGDRVLGVFSVQSYQPDLYTPEDVEVVEALAALAATALENLRLAQEQRAAEEALHESQRQLLHSQKMEAVGRLAGGIAHDFNNMLMAIGGHAELLRTEPEMPEGCRWQADEISRAAERAAGLTRQLLAFSRKQVMQPRSLSMNAVVMDMEDMLRRLIGETIRLRTSLDPGVGVVRADPGQLEQVLMNLVVNARDAMPDGGTVTLETANVYLDGEYAGLHDEVVPGPYVMLAVADTGTGMDAAVRQRIFEPFFTTKPQGKGTGLGLSTVYGVVRQTGGHVWVYSELGVGTTFKIYLPREDAPHEVPEEAPPPPRVQGAGETVLLAEDDEVVRELLRMFLQRLGYRVISAAGGEEALEVLRAQGSPPHLLLTDVVMPGMGGRELARAVREAWPEVAVIFMSGYTDDAIAQHGVLDEDSEFIQKPVSPDLLAHRIRAVLEGR